MDQLPADLPLPSPCVFPITLSRREKAQITVEYPLEMERHNGPLHHKFGVIDLTREGQVPVQVGSTVLVYFDASKASGKPFSWTNGEHGELGDAVGELFVGRGFRSAFKQAYKLPNNNFVLIQHVEIVPELRGKGIGTGVIKSLINDDASDYVACLIGMLKTDGSGRLAGWRPKRVRRYIVKLGFRAVSESFLAYSRRLKEPMSFDKAAELSQQLMMEREDEDIATFEPDSYFE